MFEQELKLTIQQVIKNLYGEDIQPEKIQVEETNKDFSGDFTFVVFPILKISKKSAEATATEIGEAVMQQNNLIGSYNVIKGFLNLTLKDSVWIDFLNRFSLTEHYGLTDIQKNAPPVVVEYSSPNTNKPMHLGHIRNNLIGQSISRILEANGNNVKQVNLINDRGIHICKTMLAWIKWENNQTPANLGMKGDKYVGNLYVKFEQELQSELQSLCLKSMNEDEALQYSTLMNEARELLVRWEEHDPEVRYLWMTMNDWVMKGFEATYKRMNISFDKLYFESETYLPGREIVLEGVNNGEFIQKEDHSIWADLRNEGLDEKILIRSDGTSVYITQDIGTAVIRHKDFQPQKMIYVVGNEQNYHFQVLKHVLKKAGYNWAEQIQHLSYGMVELPEGKMKSREGKVVDADDLMDEMYETAGKIAEEAGKASSLPKDKAEEVIEMIAQGALKYFILKVDAKKNMVFNPEESIDFNGNTGPFIQYTHARIMSLLEKAKTSGLEAEKTNCDSLLQPEKELIVLLSKYPAVVRDSSAELNPSIIAQYAYELAKSYNSFYQSMPVLKEENADKRLLRISISGFTAEVLESAFYLLGIRMPGVM
jgi:arginyl-tRNA synthetase